MHAAMTPPRKVRKHFLTRYTVKNGISNLYILLKSTLKMQEMPFQRPKFQKRFGGHAPDPPYNCVVTMASPLTKILGTPLQLFVHDTILAYDSIVRVLQTSFTLSFLYMLYFRHSLTILWLF